MLLRLIYIFIFFMLSSFCYSDDMDVLRQITMYEKVLLGADRLTFVEYGEHATMDTNPNRYDEKVIEYNANGGIKRFQRRGLKDDNVYGKIDNLHIQLDGNRLQKVTDDALPLYRSGASDFVDGADNDVEYTYNGAGALTSDANRGIANIEYDNLNHPQRVTFTNGNTIKYVYAPDGTKLRTIWLTAVDNIIVPVGSDYELSRNQILYADSTDYVGNAVYHNGNADKYLFDGGYCSFENSTPVFHYYTKDHLGNNRVVTNDNGTTEQIMHYYPFGGIITDISTNPSLQPYKYNGKELDRMHGWDKYDYGARMYDPILTVWTSVDPLAEKYYNVSPYAYCGNNPVNAVDPDGKEVKPYGNAYQIILNTLSKEEQKYIILNEKGFIDKNIMAKCNSLSNNFQSLKALVESSIQVNVTTLSETKYMSDGKIYSEEFLPVSIDTYFVDLDFSSPVGNTVGETGNLGVTYLPTKGGSGKGAINDTNIHININPTLSPVGAAETFSHEGYGHAYIYIETNGNRRMAVHNYQLGNIDANTLLIEKSIKARKETVKNMQK